MTQRITDEELEQWRAILEAWPKEEREKWHTLMHSGRLLSIVIFLDGATEFFSRLGTIGFALNRAFKGIAYIVLGVLLVKFVITGEVSLGEIWKLFAR